MEAIQSIASHFVETLNTVKEQENHIEQRIEQREAQIERLKNRRKKLSKPYWIDEVLKPLAKMVEEVMPGHRIEVLGPFGIRSEVMLVAYEGDSDDVENARSIALVPMFDHAGTNVRGFNLGVIDFSIDTGRFEQDTIGEVNGMNHPVNPLPEDVTVHDIVKLFR